MEPKLMPRDLKIVAILFIVFGSWSAIETANEILDSLLNGPINIMIRLGILQIPIGFGLLSLKYRWYRWAIIYLKLLIGLVILILFIGCIVFILDRPFNQQVIQMLKFTVGVSREMVISFVASIIISILWVTLTLWMYRVLTKPSTRELFNADTGPVYLNLRDG
jgi:hypothetical protein